VAQLNIAYTRVDFRRPAYLASDPTCPATIPVTLVHVYEVNPPADEERIEWTLLTTLPVRNAVDAERVVDIYRKRWLIEEFFAALKGGCAYRKRDLTNRFSILNTLAALVPVAWKALELRHLAHSSREMAREMFCEIELAALRAKAHSMGRRLKKFPTAQEALAVIARPRVTKSPLDRQAGKRS